MSEPTGAYGSVVGREPFATTTLRRARKTHRCACGALVLPGSAYLLHKAFPGHDADGGNWTRPQRLVECRNCAERYGRGHLLPLTAAPASGENGASS